MAKRKKKARGRRRLWLLVAGGLLIAAGWLWFSRTTSAFLPVPGRTLSRQTVNEPAAPSGTAGTPSREDLHDSDRGALQRILREKNKPR